MDVLEERTINCPYCGEPFEIEVDVSGGSKQDYYQDCPVCCRPIEIVARFDYDGNLYVTVKSEDEV